MWQSCGKSVYKLLIILLILIPTATVSAEDSTTAGITSESVENVVAPVVSNSSTPAKTAGSLALSTTKAGIPSVIGEKAALYPNQGEATAQGRANDAASAASREAKAAADALLLSNSTDKTEMSVVERLMSADADNLRLRPQPFRVGNMRQFGYSFFKKSTSFAPVLDVPISDEYLIGPGDTLVLTSSGSLDGTFPLDVNQSGEVILPKIGAVRVWGVPFGKITELLKASLSQTFRTLKVSVAMGKLRLIKVYLVGEVESPGDYNISSISTVISALSAAGGPSKNGTLRAIQVIRGGKVVETVDLYDFFLRGDKSRDIRLQPGDTINVPVHGALIGIGGNLRKPGIYEFIKETNLKELFEIAGGVPASSYLQRIQVSRVTANDKKIVEDFDFNVKLSNKEFEAKASNITLKDMDLVKIMPIDQTVRDQVRLDGYVLRPGGYALKPGMRVKDLIGKDNLLPESYPDTFEITRLMAPDSHPEKINLNLNLAMEGNEKDNILLTEFDIVKIFSRWEMDEMPGVTIRGEVLKPGKYRLFPNMTLRDLIFAAGNVKKIAYLKGAEITRIDISKERVKADIININLQEALKENPQDNIKLQNFDDILIRRVPDWSEETNKNFTVSGEVRFPGVYSIQKGEKLSSLIKRAGGYTENAYLKGAKFKRQSVREMQQVRMEEVLKRAELDLARKQQELSSVAASKEELDATKASLAGMMATLEKLKAAKAEGRLSLKLAAVDELINSPYDLVLQGGDELEIPQSTNSVLVFGEVYNPTTAIHIPGKDLGYYLKTAGGPTVNGEQDDMYVIRADGTVESRRQTASFFSDHFKGLELDAGDTIVVPQVFKTTALMRDLKDIAFIIGQVALTAGVLVAAGL